MAQPPDQSTASEAAALHQALTADKEALFLVLEHPTPDLLRAALRNPALDEHHLLALLKQRGLAQDIFAMLGHYLENRGDGYQLCLALARHSETPPHIAQALLPRLYLFDLAKLSRLAQASPDQKLAAERLIIQRLPTQPLGNKLTLARQGTAAVVEALLKEGQLQVVAACLDNPLLKEGALHQFLNSAAATAETISQIARHSRWQHRPNLRLAILKNPRTPAIWFTLWLPRMRRNEVQELAFSSRLTPHQKAQVNDFLRG